MKKKSSRFYILFSIIGTIIAFATCLAIVGASIMQKKSLDDYPKYSYHEYIDRSEAKTFKEDSGAQIYEAESLTLSGSAEVEDNIHASNQEVVTELFTGSSLTLEVTASYSLEAKLVVATSYVSQTGKAISASNLMTLSVNSNEVKLPLEINPSFDEYDFTENALALVSLNEGDNEIKITSFSNTYSIDYLVLISSKEKTTKETSIGYQSGDFKSQEKKQVFEAERQQNIQGAVIVADEKASTKYSVFFTSPDDSISFYFSSDEKATTSLAIQARKKSESSNTPGVQITVNNVEINNQPFSLMTSSYSSLDFGNIDLIKGSNTITLKNLGGFFYLDSLTLNSDINLSAAISNERFEAEDATLVNGCSISGSNHDIVGYNLPGTYVDFTLNTLEACYSRLTIRLSYVGKELDISNVIRFTLDDEYFEPLSYTLVPTDYDNFFDVLVNNIVIDEGKHSLKVISKTGNYDLDCITLFNTRIDEATTTLKMEGEDLILLGDEVKNYSRKASNSLFISNSSSTSSILLYVYLKEAYNLRLTMALSYLSPASTNSANLFDMTINNETIKEEGVEISTSSAVDQFKDVNFGEIAFNQGMNILRINNKGIVYQLDNLILTRS
jgi:hypothetical protein